LTIILGGILLRRPCIPSAWNEISMIQSGYLKGGVDASRGIAEEFSFA
jgi:hypothetical protein